MSEVELGVQEDSSSVALLERAKPALGPEKPAPDLEQLITRADNEFLTHLRESTLKPLKQVEINGKDRTSDLQVEMEIIEHTRKIETDSPGTQFLQKMVDKMREGTDLPQTRIVIMKKGNDPEAFVMPDGSIFVSQSLINMLNLDELGGVIAHELGHLANKSSERAGTMSTSWLHEIGSDVRSPTYLQQAGLNSMGLSSAIQKISQNERGTIHQSGLMRGAQVIGTHMALDFESSAQAMQELPDLLKSDTDPTNMDLVRMLADSEKPDLATTILEKLHASDLFQIQYYGLGGTPAAEQVSADLNELLHRRAGEWLTARGADPSLTPLFVFLSRNQDTNVNANQSLHLNNPNDTIGMLKTLAAPDAHIMLKELSQYMFGKDWLIGFGLPANAAYLHRLIEGLSSRMYVGNKQDAYTIFPVNEDVLTTVGDLLHTDHFSISDNPHEVFSLAILRYAERQYFLDGRFDMEGARAFFAGLRPYNDVMTVKNVTPKSDSVYMRSYSIFAKDGDFVHIPDTEKAKLQTLFLTEMFDYSEESQTDNIDQYFEDIENRDMNTNEKKNKYEQLLKTVKDELDDEGADNDARLTKTREFAAKIDAMTIQGDRYNVLSSLDRGSKHPDLLGVPADGEVHATNVELIRANLKMITAASLFQEDSEQYYEFLNETLNAVSINPDTMSNVQIVNFLQPVLATQNSLLTYAFGTDSRSYGDNWRYIIHASPFDIGHIDQLAELPFLRDLIKRPAEPAIETLPELTTYAHQLYGRVHDARRSFYSTNLVDVLIGGRVRSSLEHILSKPIETEDLPLLRDLHGKYGEGGPEANSKIERMLDKQFLQSDEPVTAKIRYISEKGGDPEDYRALADQIDDLETYRLFRRMLGTKLESLLHGGRAVGMAAAADIASGLLGGKYEELLKTCLTSGHDTVDISTRAVAVWCRGFMFIMHDDLDQPPLPGDLERTNYDPDSNRVIIPDRNAFTARTFHTPRDLFDNLHTMPESKRFAVALKSLAERDGALSTPESRSNLAGFVNRTLNLPEGFTTSTLTAACETADLERSEPETVALLLAKVIAPTLYRGLSVDNIDYARLLETRQYPGYDEIRPLGPKIGDIVTEEQLRALITARTSDVLVPRFVTRVEALDSDAGRFFQNSFRQSSHISELVGQIIHTEEEQKPASKEPELDPSLEAVIGGVESSGALGVRSLQLARQLERFSPAVEKRLSKSFDSNEGMDKLRFWENMIVQMERDPAFNDFIESKLVRVGDYLGGGSLYTTYDAVIRDDDGAEKSVVIKMLNPNAAAFVQKGYKIAHASLGATGEKIRGRKGRTVRKQAEMSKMLIDLSNQWCLKDINDPTFEEDDDNFRKVVDGYNAQAGDNVMHMPRRKFMSPKIKVEERATGITLNQVLLDPGVDEAEKRKYIDQLNGFFAYQLQKVPDAGEKRLVHSDPHPGNYIVDRSTGEMTVIDRHMYLQLSKSEAATFQALHEGSRTDFLTQFIEDVCAANKTGDALVKARVLPGILREYLKERSSGQVSDRALLQKLLGSLSDRGLTVPLELQLMIRNVAGMKSLREEHGMTSSKPDEPGNATPLIR